MTWTSFTLTYAALILCFTIMYRRLFAGAAMCLVRTLIFGTLLLLLGDALAEQRGLWLIPRPRGVYILDLPVENSIIVLATLLNSLVPYLILRRRSSQANRTQPS